MARLIRKIGLGIRDAWLILGATLGLLLALEGAYRLQGAVRRAIRGDAGDAVDATGAELHPLHPHANAQWWRDIATGQHPVEGGGIRYDPFRGWWPRPQRSRYMNVDEQGLRFTAQPTRSDSVRRLIFMFGGSTMWGWVVPDSSTIPSRIAAHLHARGYTDVDVVNLSQSMFNVAQNTATLLLELRQGRVPAVAVFLDGNNEVAPVFQSGRTGTVLNEGLIARRFETQPGLGPDLMALVRRSAFIRRLIDRPAGPTTRGSQDLCPDIAGQYARGTTIVSSLTASYRFHPLFFWQPMLATTGKQRSAWEREIPTDSGWARMIRRCTQLVDSLLAPALGQTFFPLHTLFDGDTTTVFTDDYGHLTERANDVVARYMTDVIARRLGPPDGMRP